jgi:hypothetical protein
MSVHEPIGYANKWCNGPFYKFIGWDYTELLWKWNMPERGDYDDINRESPNVELIKFFIKRILYREYGKPLTYFDKRVIKDLRLHVKALSKVPTGYENFWKGVYETKDDDVFLSIMETNIASAWS